MTTSNLNIYILKKKKNSSKILSIDNITQAFLTRVSAHCQCPNQT